MTFFWQQNPMRLSQSREGMLKRAKREGYVAGYNAAIYTDWDEDTEELAEAASESELNARQFSPFEHFASDLNRQPEEFSDELWAEYEEGVSKGIDEGVEERLHG